MDDPFDIPPDIATCPACGAGLIAQVTEWYEEDDGRHCGEHGAEIGCSKEPDIDSEVDWMDWFDSHAHTLNMPYVYWLPEEQKVYAWLETNVRFVSGREEKEKLEKWKKSVEGT
jgi:hypothetical protein